MIEARVGAGFANAAEGAARAGVKYYTYVQHENGIRGISKDKAAVYARAFGVDVSWLLYGKGEPGEQTKPAAPHQSAPGPMVNLDDLRAYIRVQNGISKASPSPSGRLRPVNRSIPVMGEVAAGLWRDAPARHIEDAEEHIALDVPGYERARLTALRVVGPSMDLVYPPGRYVIVAHPAEAGLRVGDYVVVERQKADLVELTIKEFTDENGRVALWPRSSHPDFQTPIYLKGPDDDGDQAGVQIVGVVIADYGKRDRPPIMFDPARRI